VEDGAEVERERRKNTSSSDFFFLFFFLDPQRRNKKNKRRPQGAENASERRLFWLDAREGNYDKGGGD
jgi:hypothetical protein